MTVLCPKCGSEARQSTTRFGVRHDHCDLWSWDGAPLVDSETREARKRAHEAFDLVWKGGGVSRSCAYKLLAEKMQMSRRDCHIKLMTVDLANKVPGIAQQILAEIGVAI